METVLIADDEVNIREGLKIIIDWNELGFEICGEAANGEEALSAILEKNPSLVLLDIRMPKMYGTDLIRIARERGYKGRFIIPILHMPRPLYVTAWTSISPSPLTRTSFHRRLPK